MKSQDDVFFALISTLSLRETVSGEQIERLFIQHQRMKADAARRAYDAGMLSLQAELPVIAEKGKSATGTYAKYEDVIEAVRPICLKHGFVLTHRTEADRDRVRVTAILAHRDGHREENGLPLPHDKSDNKSEIHAEVSAVSYGKRITALAILGIVTRGEDDDGKRASVSQEVETITADQKIDVLKVVAETGSDLQALLAMWKVESLDDVLSSKVAQLKAELRNAARTRKTKEAAQ